MTEIDQKLAMLRKEWREKPEMRPIIEMRARAVELAKSARLHISGLETPKYLSLDEMRSSLL